MNNANNKDSMQLSDRQQCELCEALILPSTFIKNKGLCGRCRKDINHFLKLYPLGLFDKELKRFSRFLWLKRMVGFGWRKNYSQKAFRDSIRLRVENEIRSMNSRSD
ncbi:hypothetical protein ASG44_07050 [Methylophilus sp. Leaf459]|nr:hypothetical protein ASG34_07075 [Methylophilus sp. Leaf416]KQT56682.1 hypothetical protein ASG44_07050 [Methylophilus sp. Leaf459]